MYKAVITCVLFFVLCEAKIKIQITVASSISKSKIKHEGDDIKPISDMEINLFNLTDEKLCEGMRIRFGKAPLYIYLQDPSENVTLFEPLGWIPVKRYMGVSNARLVHVGPRQMTYISTYPGNETTEELQTYFDSKVHSSWSSTGVPCDAIHLDFEIKFDKGFLKYDETWRNAKMQQVSFCVSEEEHKNIEMAIKTIPGRLSLTETVVNAEIEYSAQLVGNVLGSYNNTGNYHFYGPTVEEVMMAANLKNEIITTQNIHIRSIIDAKFEVYDDISGQYLQLNLAVYVKNSTDLKTKLAAAGDKLVVILFMTTSCEECQTMEIKLNEMSNDIVPLKVDVNTMKDIATQYKVISVPTFVFMLNSEKIEQFSGADVEKLKMNFLKLKYPITRDC